MQQCHGIRGTSSGNLEPRKELTTPEERLPTVQDKSVRYKTKMMSHQKARKEVPTRKDYGEARNAKRA
jgi:hypothetical protein